MKKMELFHFYHIFYAINIVKLSCEYKTKLNIFKLNILFY